jgi:lambda repressor-like predicted transcriptional regulator
MRGKGTGRVRRSESDWRAIIEQLDRSGKTREAFCRETGISPSTLALWQRRVRVASLPAQFIDVTPVARPSAPWSIEIAFPDGTTARVRG